MLKAYPSDASTPEAPGGDALRASHWIDLLDPSDEEIRAVEHAVGLHVPTRAEVSEIEVSSRLKRVGGALYMSAPLIAQDGSAWFSTPTGFVLSREVCLTVRFAGIPAFDRVEDDLDDTHEITPPEAFTRILEEIVDLSADHLEATADQLNTASRAIFDPKSPNEMKLSRDTAQLRRLMTDIGRASERMSYARYTLVSLARMSQFVTDRGSHWISPSIAERLGGVRSDIASLEQFEENLLSRVQLLQDAATAFISIEQNEVVKVLTIASVVGIPPVVIAGIYGMNFKYMPELNWHYGYAYALVLIVITTAIPLLIFKWKDWM